MFKHILVPTDLTDRDRKSMEIAVKMARENAGNITLLHVVETIENTETEDFHKFYKQLGLRAAKKMDLIIDLYRQSGVAIEKTGPFRSQGV